MFATSSDDTSTGEASSAPLIGFGIAWALFWILLTTVSVQDQLRQGNPDIWKPLLWEGSSFVVASAIAWTQWQRARHLDPLLARPWRWFGRNLQWLPVVAPAFVFMVFALRHGVYALLGQTYVHEGWGTVLRYESLKFSMFYLLFAAIVFGIRSHAALSNARARVEREQGLSQRAQLLQLTQQIEPHFLFNALNTIASTIHTDPSLADALMTKLAALLRATTDLARQPQTTLDEELRLLEGYAAIMHERFSDRVSVKFEVDPGTRSCRVPTLVLQPLLENAFRHGVERRLQLTTIVVRTARAGGRLQLEVRDDAGVMVAAPVFGVGLSNLQQRLLASYGTRASLTLHALEPAGVSARIELPCEC